MRPNAVERPVQRSPRRKTTYFRIAWLPYCSQEKEYVRDRHRRLEPDEDDASMSLRSAHDRTLHTPDKSAAKYMAVYGWSEFPDGLRALSHYL